MTSKQTAGWNPQQCRANVQSLQSKHVVFESSVIISFALIFYYELKVGGWK